MGIVTGAAAVARQARHLGPVGRLLGRKSLVGAAAGVATGALAWSLTEYLAHRFVLHGPASRHAFGPLSVGSVHRHHHGEPEATDALARVAGCVAMAGVGALAGSALARVLPTAFARAAGLTWGAGYTAYDQIHWSLHHRAPTTAVGRRLRQRHMRHHFAAPRTNLGVTTGWCDRLFGTEAPHEHVTVPARHAPRWLAELGPSFEASAPRQPAASAHDTTV